MNIDDIVREAMENSNFMETLKAKIQEAEEKAKNWPNDGDTVWHFGKLGNMYSDTWFNSNKYEMILRETGNMFHTKEEAREAWKRDFYRDKLRSLGRPFIRGRENWFIAYDYEEDKIVYYCWTTDALESVYFNSRADAQKALDEIGFGNYYKYIICGKE